MKPVIERLGRGGERVVTLHRFAFNGSILDLSSSIDRKFAELSEKKYLKIQSSFFRWFWKIALQFGQIPLQFQRFGKPPL